MIGIIDTETTTKTKGNVYNPENELCLVVIKVISQNSMQLLSFKKPWDVGRINEILCSLKLLVFFNGKFDLSWLRREFGFIPAFGTRLHDCQYAEFIFSDQTVRFPNLKDSCAKRSLGEKYDYIASNYWDKGIDTCDIPEKELEDYCIQDVNITHQLYIEQIKQFETDKKHLYKLFKLHMLDLQVLLEMEWNGLLYNKEKSLQLAEEYDANILELENKLNQSIDFELNWNSNAEKSSILYGGPVKRTTKVPVGHFKSGQRVGDIKYKNVETITDFPRLVSPLKINGQEDNLSVAEPVLRSLSPKKAVAKLIDLILERAKMEKLNGTYLKGLPKKLEEMNWGTVLHPSYNNCVAVTGRVASSNPNGQNIPPVGKRLCESRF